MGFLSSKSNNGQAPYYTGLQVQTSSNCIPIPIIYGANKTAPNYIWTGGYYGYWGHPEGSSGGQGGKGGGSGGSSGGGNSSNNSGNAWQSYTSWEMGVCEGPIAGYGSIWLGQTPTNFYGANIWAAYSGSYTQTAWGEVAVDFPSQALAYRGLAYLASFNYYMGNTYQLPQFSLEVFGVLFNSSGINGGDADPAQIIYDFLTNPNYGVGFPITSIDTTTLFSPPGNAVDNSYQGYCRASYLAMSPVLANQESANSTLHRWLQLTNTAAVWSGDTLKFIPYGDTVVGPTANQLVTTGGGSGNTTTWTPNVTPLYSLTDDDFVHGDGEDPVQVLRVDPFSVPNWQRIQISWRVSQYLPISLPQPWVYWEQENSYVPNSVDAWDQSAIEQYGLRMAPDITANEICDMQVAQNAAQLILQRGNYIRAHYKFKLSFEYCLLEPMDIVEITDPNLGLNATAVRIIEIQEDEYGILDVTAEEFPPGIATSVKYPIQPNVPNSSNLQSVPARVNTPVIFEPPQLLINKANVIGGTVQIWIGASGSVATGYLLAETTSSGPHYTSQALPAPYAAGTIFVFSVYAQAQTRSAIRLNIYNGSTPIGCDFNLSTGEYGAPDNGVTDVIMTSVGGGWYQCQIAVEMAFTAPPIFYVLIENPEGTTSYSGTSGDGVYIWGAEFSAQGGTASASMSYLPPFSAVYNATIAANGVSTPEGVENTADPNWGGAYVWLSMDGITYNQVGQINGAVRQGFLTSALAAYSSANPDTVDTLSVSLVESGGALSSGTAVDAANGVTLCLVDNELLAFETATLTGPNAYSMTPLYRGLYGTAPVAHSSGAPFARLDTAIFEYTLPSAWIGQTIYAKLQSFNVFGTQVEDLSTCTAYSYTPTGIGYITPMAIRTALGIEQYQTWTAPNGSTVTLGVAEAIIDLVNGAGLGEDSSGNFFPADSLIIGFSFLVLSGPPTVSAGLYVEFCVGGPYTVGTQIAQFSPGTLTTGYVYSTSANISAGGAQSIWASTHQPGIAYFGGSCSVRVAVQYITTTPPTS